MGLATRALNAGLATVSALAVLCTGLIVASLGVQVVWPLVVAAASGLTSGWLLAKAQRTAPPAEQKVDVKNLQEEIVRLRAQRIQLDRVESVLGLGLLDVDAAITDVKQQALQHKAKTWTSREHTTEYLGCLTLRKRMRFGIDLRKVVLRRTDGTIQVGLLQPEFQGGMGEEAVWRIRELRDVRGRIWYGLEASTEIRESDAMLAECADAQRAELVARIENGTELAWIGPIVCQSAEISLRILLSPLGLPLEFVNKEIDGMPLPQFVSAYNHELQQRMEVLQRRAA